MSTKKVRAPPGAALHRSRRAVYNRRKQFGIFNEIFQERSRERTNEIFARTGYHLLEIAPFTIAKSVNQISAAERRHIANLAKDAGLGISGLHWVLVQAEGMYVSHPEKATRARTSHYFVDLVDCAADLGGTRIIVGSPKQRNLLPGVTYEEAWKFATETFQEAIKRAEERGVVICFEPLAPSETDFINTAAEAIRFAGQFSSRAMSVILDVKAMSSEAKTIPEIIRESAGRFAYFHANDRNLKGPGFGDVDYRPIAEALRAVQYDGIVSVEVFRFEEGPEMIATESLRYLREVFGTS
jgi:sugar phosphate isomerase/epimerase